MLKHASARWGEKNLRKSDRSMNDESTKSGFDRGNKDLSIPVLKGKKYDVFSPDVQRLQVESGIQSSKSSDVVKNWLSKGSCEQSFESSKESVEIQKLHKQEPVLDKIPEAVIEDKSTAITPSR